MYFFFRISGKKKNRCIYFFPRNSLKATHSAERQLPLVKRHFCTFVVYFFFPNKNVYFFFPRNSLLPTHSLVLKGRKKKIQPRKKKIHFFTHSLDFFPKMSKNKLFQEKKNTVPLGYVISNFRESWKNH